MAKAVLGSELCLASPITARPVGTVFVHFGSKESSTLGIPKLDASVAAPAKSCPYFPGEKPNFRLGYMYTAMPCLEARLIYTQAYNGCQIWEGICRGRQAQGAINWRGVPPFRAESNTPRYFSATTAAGILQACGIPATRKVHPPRTRDGRVFGLEGCQRASEERALRQIMWKDTSQLRTPQHQSIIPGSIRSAHLAAERRHRRCTRLSNPVTRIPPSLRKSGWLSSAGPADLDSIGPSISSRATITSRDPFHVPRP